MHSPNINQHAARAAGQIGRLACICEMTAKLLDCETSFSVLCTPGAQGVEPVACYTVSAAGRVGVTAEEMEKSVARLHGSDVILLDERRLCLALRCQGTPLAVQFAARAEQAQPFGPEHLRIAHQIADFAALGLEDALLIERLTLANRLNADVLSTLSHELRAPLNAMVMTLELLVADGIDDLPEGKRSRLRKLQPLIREMESILDSALQMTRLEEGRIPLMEETTDLARTLEELDEETKALRAERGLAFAWRIAPNLPELRTDPVKLKIVLKNLIGNAIKFTHEGGVTVGVDPMADAIEISVADTGVGLPKDMFERIFEPFSQADPPASQRQGGVGLGLHVTRRLLEILGGTITLDSEPGIGTTFRIRLPAMARAAEHRPPLS